MGPDREWWVGTAFDPDLQPRISPQAHGPGGPAADSEAAWTLALLIAKCRFGSGVDMGGKHNPRASEIVAANRFIREHDVAHSSCISAERVEALIDFLDECDVRGCWNPPTVAAYDALLAAIREGC